MSVVELADGHAPAMGSPNDVRTDLWRPRIYVSGDTPRSLVAYANLKSLCELHLTDRYLIEIIDLLAHPLLARDDEIVAVPTWVRLAQAPTGQIIDDLSGTDEVVDTLRLRSGRF